MKINQNDICYNDTLTYYLLSKISTKADALRKESERWNKVGEYAVVAINEGIVTDTKSLEDAIELLNNSSLTPVEILEKITKTA